MKPLNYIKFHNSIHNYKMKLPKTSDTLHNFTYFKHTLILSELFICIQHVHNKTTSCVNIIDSFIKIHTLFVTASNTTHKPQLYDHSSVMNALSTHYSNRLHL